jgi:hypothetical protein
LALSRVVFLLFDPRSVVGACSLNFCLLVGLVRFAAVPLFCSFVLFCCCSVPFSSLLFSLDVLFVCSVLLFGGSVRFLSLLFCSVWMFCSFVLFGSVRFVWMFRSVVRLGLALLRCPVRFGAAHRGLYRHPVVPSRNPDYTSVFLKAFVPFPVSKTRTRSTIITVALR